MDRLFLLLRETKDSYLGGADSFTDRISNQYTVSILVMFAIMTTTRQFVSEPISCWCPVSFSKDQVDYVNKVCWTTSTYFLPESVTEIPIEGQPIDRVSYYQWIPLMAIGQAAMFYAPRIIWSLLNKNSGIAVNTITDAAVERQRRAEQAAAEKTMEFMTKTLGKFLKELSWDCAQRSTAGEESLRGCCKRCSSLSCICNSGLYRRLRVTFYGNYLTCLYVGIKIVYLTNVLVQIALLNSFLKTNYSLYGLETLSKMLSGDDWTTSHRFPRIAMCNFIVRAMGENMHRYSVQCAIPINLLHEIFYIFLWFWLVFVFIVTLASLLGWLVVSFPEAARMTYVRNKVYADGKMRRNPDRETEEIFYEFVARYLQRDGCFIARLVAKNTSTIVAADLLGGLWKDYVIKTRLYRTQRGQMSAPVAGDKVFFRPESLTRIRSYAGRSYKSEDKGGEGGDMALMPPDTTPFAPPFDLSPPPASVFKSFYEKTTKSGDKGLDDVDGGGDANDEVSVVIEDADANNAGGRIRSKNNKNNNNRGSLTPKTSSPLKALNIKRPSLGMPPLKALRGKRSGGGGGGDDGGGGDGGGGGDDGGDDDGDDNTASSSVSPSISFAKGTFKGRSGWDNSAANRRRSFKNTSDVSVENSNNNNINTNNNNNNNIVNENNDAFDGNNDENNEDDNDNNEEEEEEDVVHVNYHRNSTKKLLPGNMRM